MINMLVSSFDHLSATAYYRTWGTFKEVKRLLKLDDLDFNAYEMPRKLDWRTIQGADIAYFERPHRREDVEAMIHLKRQGIKIWIDYDDDLFDLQIENPAYSFYGEQAKIGARKACEIADLVTVSTLKLQEKYQTNSLIVRNQLNGSLYPKNIESRDNYVAWRGGISHAGDLYESWGEIKKILEKYQILFIGGVPDFVKYESKTNKNIKIAPPMKLEDYFVFLSTIKPKCFIAPLTDNDFNHGKSNILAQEALVAGAVTVAPKWHEWQLIGSAHHYDEDYSLSTMVEVVMESDRKEQTSEDIELQTNRFHQEMRARVGLIKSLKI